MRKSTPKLSLQDSTVEAFKPALRDAIKKGDLQTFKQLLAYPVPPQLKKLLLEDDLLALAVVSGSPEIVQDLLKEAKALGTDKIGLQKKIVYPMANVMSPLTVALLGVAAFQNQSVNEPDALASVRFSPCSKTPQRLNTDEIINKREAYQAIAQCLLSHDDEDQQQRQEVQRFLNSSDAHEPGCCSMVNLSGCSVGIGDQAFSAVRIALIQTTPSADLVQAINAAFSDPGQVGSSQNIVRAGSQELPGLYQQPGNPARRPF